MEKYIDFLLGGVVKGTKNADALFSGTYVLGVVFAIIMLLIAAVVAKSIYSVPDGSDITKRKRWFWGLSVVAPVLFSLYNYFFIINNIKGLPNIGKFKTTIAISFVVMLVVYILFGVLISFVFKKGKVGDWFFADRKFKQ